MHRKLLSQLDLNLLIVLDVLLEEQHVTRTAKRLHRSQSAISHALNRLRIQLDDPLLIKNGGKMQLSTKARRLKPMLSRVLQDLEDALADEVDWDPSTCTRHFSLVGPDFTAVALPALLSVLAEQAPRATCELAPVGEDMFDALVDGRRDLVLFRNIDTPSHVLNDPVCTMRHVVFMRRGHPALDAWGMESWLAFPHIRIRMVGGPSPVAMRLADDKLQRRFGPVVSSFLMTPPIIENTDAMLTAPLGVMARIIQRHDIVTKPCPAPIADIKLSLFSSTAEDAAQAWFRRIAHQVLRETFAVDAAA